MDSDRRSWIRRMELFAVPFVLVAVALVQIVRAHVVGQSAWKGGGFGMFSTVDSSGARFFRAYLIKDGLQLAVPIPDRLEDLVHRTKIVPTDENLQLIADELATEQWVHSDFAMRALEVRDHVTVSPDNDDAPTMVIDPAPSTRRTVRVQALHVADPIPAPSDLVEFDSIRVDFWKYEYERDTSTIRARKTRSVRADKVLE
jgi:hypothetical protein